MERNFALKLRQLKYVVAIADNGLNMTAAANSLYTSQPGVSKQLKQLEEELGVEIFVRHGKNLIRITPVGQEIIARARVIVREAENIKRMCRAQSPAARICKTG
ncbi:MAG TPA: LysR family transcriptional regulator [Woeseiaceae bacterium]|nr:LysR family transcriptional regulator [Woeseiaceae bacterium]